MIDPFLNKEVEISNRLVDRLRGKYANGPIMENGEPEFGWRDFSSGLPPIHAEAANEIERLTKIVNDRDAKEAFLIWSNQHKSWWRPNSQGYTYFVEKAGRYNREQAMRIAAQTWRHAENGPPDEIAIPEYVVVWHQTLSEAMDRTAQEVLNRHRSSL
jgi:hypothetical protein